MYYSNVGKAILSYRFDKHINQAKLRNIFSYSNEQFNSSFSSHIKSNYIQILRKYNNQFSNSFLNNIHTNNLNVLTMISFRLISTKTNVDIFNDNLSIADTKLEIKTIIESLLSDQSIHNNQNLLELIDEYTNILSLIYEICSQKNSDPKQENEMEEILEEGSKVIKKIKNEIYNIIENELSEFVLKKKSIISTETVNDRNMLNDCSWCKWKWTDGFCIRIIPGLGGKAASDSSEDLINAYSEVVNRFNDKFDIIRSDSYKEMYIYSSNPKLLNIFSFEEGTHRVFTIAPQSARLFTSSIQVVLLELYPTPTINLNSGVKMSTAKAAGPGGQSTHANKTAVKLQHLETGTIAESKKFCNQSDNRVAAYNLLSSKLLTNQQNLIQLLSEKSMNDRLSDSKITRRVRTMNYRSNTLTDNRINISASFDELFNGDAIINFSSELSKERQKRSLERLENELFILMKRIIN